MSECETCGRKDEGHWIGCVKTTVDETYVFTDEEFAAGVAACEAASNHCTFGGCTEPRRSADKRVKFCTEHSDPKNRK